jgi:hypothetical protein
MKVPLSWFGILGAITAPPARIEGLTPNAEDNGTLNFAFMPQLWQAMEYLGHDPLSARWY